MDKRIITEGMIVQGARFNAFRADGVLLGQRVVVPVGPDLDQFILLTTEFTPGITTPRFAEHLADVMTKIGGYEPVEISE